MAVARIGAMGDALGSSTFPAHADSRPNGRAATTICRFADSLVTPLSPYRSTQGSWFTALLAGN